MSEALLKTEPNWFVVGDSHALSIGSGATPLSILWRASAVGGETAIGMRNPNSATRALKSFPEVLVPPPGVVPVLHLGEVDCGFVIWTAPMNTGERRTAALGVDRRRFRLRA